MFSVRYELSRIYYRVIVVWERVYKISSFTFFLVWVCNLERYNNLGVYKFSNRLGPPSEARRNFHTELLQTLDAMATGICSLLPLGRKQCEGVVRPTADGHEPGTADHRRMDKLTR